jgi:hypothetical protein
MHRNFITVPLTCLLIAGAAPSTLRGQKNPPASPAVTPSTVPNGTRFLIRLDDELSTAKHRPGKKFKAKTIEPLVTTDGAVVEPGAQVRGHVTRIEPAGITGHARMWLSFDEIHSKAGKLYLVADVVDVPGDHHVRADELHEGEISTKTSKGRREIEAAAAGAAIGAAVGARAHGGKGAAIGAAAGGAAGFLIASGVGQELVLQKGTKLELELERPLYIAKR